MFLSVFSRYSRAIAASKIIMTRNATSVVTPMTTPTISPPSAHANSSVSERLSGPNIPF